MRGTVKAVAIAGGKTYEAPAAANGQYELRLPPGQYNLTGSSPLYGGGAYECFLNEVDPLTIREGETTTADVICPIG